MGQERRRGGVGEQGGKGLGEGAGAQQAAAAQLHDHLTADMTSLGCHTEQRW